MNKKIAIIGGSGFIGNALKKFYSELNYDIISFELGTDKLISETSGLKTIVSSNKNSFIDVTHLVDCDLVFYLIGGEFKSQLNYSEQFQNSVPVFERFLSDISNLQSIPKVVFFSSAGTVYGSSLNFKNESDQLFPFGSYGVVKSAMESILSDFSNGKSFDYLILRVSNPFGIGQVNSAANGFIVNVLNNYFKGNPIRLSKDLEIYRDYIFIDDLCKVIHRLVENNAKGIFNISSGISYSLDEIIGFIRQSGIHFKNEIVDYLKPSVKYNFVSNEKLLTEIGGFEFKSINDGIREIIDLLDSKS